MLIVTSGAGIQERIITVYNINTGLNTGSLIRDRYRKIEIQYRGAIVVIIVISSEIRDHGIGCDSLNLKARSHCTLKRIQSGLMRIGLRSHCQGVNAH